MKQLQVGLLFLIVICMCNASMGYNFTCNEAERRALLVFKHSFTYDGLSPLGSWVGHDCCSSWKGVGCDNVTGHVIKLDLGRCYDDEFIELEAGEVNPALVELKFLKYLDLSCIYFNQSVIPDFLGSMRQLQHLILSLSSFTGKVPHNLGNLTELVSLDLTFPFYSGEFEGKHLERAFDSLNILHKLQKLKYLDLSGVDLSQALDSLNILHKLPSLSVLNLAECILGSSHAQLERSYNISSSPLQRLDLGNNLFSGPIPHFIQNLSSLKYLHLSNNQLNSPILSWFDNKVDLEYLNLRGNYFNGSFPTFIQRLSFITSLDLSHNEFSFSIPSWLGNNTYLEHLDLSFNQFNSVDGGIMNIIGRLCRLKSLDLFFNQLQKEVSESHANYSKCSKYNLEYLDMSYNNISVVSSVIGSFSSLKILDLSNNNLETLPPSLGNLSSLESLRISFNRLETLPPSLGNLSSLESLRISFNRLETLPPSFGNLSSLNDLDLSHNNLVVVHQVSLGNLFNLTYLDISYNSNSVILDLSPDWMPPFQLHYLSVLTCKINTSFPKWISSQHNIQELDLSDTGIFGALPQNIGTTMPNLTSLRLANNHINGSIPLSLCWLENLEELDLHKNQLSGMIPDFWTSSRIDRLDLSSNRLSGPIPTSLAELPSLQLLSLNNNLLEGELPLQLTNSAQLTIFDVGRNKFHGDIPLWDGANYPSLQIVILRENRLNGTIPQQLCSFRALQIIDLAKNNLVGIIPACFGDFPRMGFVQQSEKVIADAPSNIAAEPTVSTDEWSAVESIKGADREYTSVLHLLVNMDLSSNNLVGVIPPNIFTLIYLVGLNLSRNHLNGIIPEEIGKMTSLESLDLSINSLSGTIPESLSSLDSLSSLNLSFNNLHGQIPTSPHLQTLNNVSIYMGNLGLCGDPLPSCFPTHNDHTPTNMVDEEHNKHEKMWLYLIIMSGFATGFWGIIGTLVLNLKWRHAYFGIAEKLADWIYVEVAVRIVRAKRTP